MKISKSQWLVAITLALLIHGTITLFFLDALMAESIADAEEPGIEIDIGINNAVTESEPEPVPVVKAATEPEPEPEPTSIPEPEPLAEPEPHIEPMPNVVSESISKSQPDSATEIQPVKIPVATREQPTVPQHIVSSAPAEFVREFTPPPEIEIVEPSKKIAQHISSEIKQEATGVDPLVRQSYYAKLAAWLGRHKEYPMIAKRRRMTGIVKVRFSINQRGELIASQLIDSSGHILLDEAALEMLQKATPYPPIPNELHLNELTITLPVEYNLKG